MFNLGSTRANACAPLLHIVCPEPVAVLFFGETPFACCHAPNIRREQLAVDLRREFTAVIAEADAEAQSSFDIEGSLGGGAAASVLPLLSLTTTALSFSTLTRVLFRIAFQYK